MKLKSYDDLLAKVKESPKLSTVAVAGAADEHVIEAVIDAEKLGITRPVFIGDVEKIKAILKEYDVPADEYLIVAADTPEECGERAVELVKEGKADYIMKGMVETKDVLKPLVKKENGLHTGRTISHVVIDEIKAFGQLIVMTDGGMVPYPTLENKRDIIINAVETLKKLGYERPSAAVLCAVEKVNPKMVETTDAAALVEMAKNGEIKDCDVVGPISFDLASSAEIAKIKNYDCEFCGNFDIYVVPNMVAGNLLNKGMLFAGNGKMAGIIVGAKVPVVMTSRGSSADEKFTSLALAALVSQ
ncbi:MAG: phosphate acyltransferase [Bacillota bacterium]|nr:phosphate acyltransferase [Bacillota bacterium]